MGGERGVERGGEAVLAGVGVGRGEGESELGQDMSARETG